mmetsp:Transcript_16734/g.50001  ORF Transcript_16734/g.50001 Transcript_16734/m.50001 type:complete len:519 (-) Transcript_16734:2569-4125(-)
MRANVFRPGGLVRPQRCDNIQCLAKRGAGRGGREQPVRSSKPAPDPAELPKPPAQNTDPVAAIPSSPIEKSAGEAKIDALFRELDTFELRIEEAHDDEDFLARLLEFDTEIAYPTEATMEALKENSSVNRLGVKSPGSGSAGTATKPLVTSTRLDAPGGVMRPRITVLGGGVIGLATAVVLQEAFPRGSVTVAARAFLQDTTSHGAAGLWEPVKLGSEQDPTQTDRWAGVTYQHLQRLHASADALAAGVICTPGYSLFSGGVDHAAPVGLPSWTSQASHVHRLSPTELNSFAQPYQGGFAYTTYICEGGRYLPYLTRRFQKAGGRLVVADPKTPDELEELLDEGNPKRLDCHVLVNCTGLDGARDLFGDMSVYPIRGQILRVRAPWIKSYYNVDNEHYIIPNIDTVVLGGTGQYSYEPKGPDAADRQHILGAACAHLPSLMHAEILEDWVGFRPGRPSVRQELGTWRGGLPVVHSYGHGGSGITLHWGVAEDNLVDVKFVLHGCWADRLANNDVSTST